MIKVFELDTLGKMHPVKEMENPTQASEEMYRFFHQYQNSTAFKSTRDTQSNREENR